MEWFFYSSTSSQLNQLVEIFGYLRFGAGFTGATGADFLGFGLGFDRMAPDMFALTVSSE